MPDISANRYKITTDGKGVLETEIGKKGSKGHEIIAIDKSCNASFSELPGKMVQAFEKNGYLTVVKIEKE